MSGRIRQLDLSALRGFRHRDGGPRRNWGVDLTGVPQLPTAIATKLKQSKPLTDSEEATARDVYLAAGHVIQTRVAQKVFTGEAIEAQEEWE